MDDLERVLSELYRSALGRLCTYGYLLTGSQLDAEDLVQESIVKVFSKRRRLTDVRAAEAYVRAAMRTVHLDAVRRGARWRRLMPGQAIDQAEPDPADEIVATDDVDHALRTLPPRVRVAAVLRFHDDLTVEEIAREMGIAGGTVKTLLHRARQALGPWLEDERRGRDEGATVAVEPASKGVRHA
ncbi:RNA polymerase sigma factor [Demequina rhizosphaerae]|uniref:RNA polymerase sigma factor n=1 Tax=Demequina rhizosphaerae TaxID=1638985 RepID=UPI00078552AA|nr:sigma-70 family RNA polymerase sigma factor [Demequina rhizosphaerae]